MPRPQLESLANFFGIAMSLVVFRPHRKTSRNDSALARRYAEHAEPLRSACKAPTKIVKRPRPDRRSDLSLRATVVAERTIRAIEHNLPVLGKVSNTRRIIGIIGMSCGTPFLVRSPGNSTASAVISPRANSVISLRRVPVKISSSISAPVAPPLASATSQVSLSSASSSLDRKTSLLLVCEWIAPDLESRLLSPHTMQRMLLQPSRR